MKYLVKIIVAMIIIILAMGIFLARNLTSKEVLIEQDFGSKIVYEIRENLKIIDYENDCIKRGGIFNECGNVCEPDAEVCVMMCAFTCEDINK